MICAGTGRCRRYTNQYTAPTNTPPITLPNVTGTRLVTSDPGVSAGKVSGVSPVAIQKCDGAPYFTSRLKGSKYMFATECSKPAATKPEIGGIMARILSVIVR